MPSDAEINQLVNGINQLKGQGTYRELFDKFDADRDGLINRAELTKLLKEADVGNRFTRGAWVSGIIDAADEQLGTADQKVSWNEFQALVGGRINSMLHIKMLWMFRLA